MSINDTLEKRCALFWRLEEIWGTWPNVANPIAIELGIPPSYDAPPTSYQFQPSLSQPAAAASPTDSEDPGDPIDPQLFDYDSLEWQLSPPAASPPGPSPPKPSSTRSTPKPTSERSTPSRLMSGSCSGSGSRGKRDWCHLLKQALEDRTSA